MTVTPATLPRSRPDDQRVPGRLHPAAGDDPLWYGDRVAAFGGWHDDTFVAELRMLEDAVTFRLELTASGHLTITRDVGFEGTDVWEGDAPHA